MHNPVLMVVLPDRMKRLLPFLAFAAVLCADDVPLGPDGKPVFGHSTHGASFDEGPRQAGPLLPGMGELRLVSATVAIAVAEQAAREGVAEERLTEPIQEVYERMWQRSERRRAMSKRKRSFRQGRRCFRCT